jgi:RNA polymerase primary sigma factor
VSKTKLPKAGKVDDVKAKANEQEEKESEDDDLAVLTLKNAPIKKIEEEMISEYAGKKEISEQELMSATEKYCLSEENFAKLAAYLTKKGFEITEQEDESEKADSEDDDDGEKLDSSKEEKDNDEESAEEAAKEEDDEAEEDAPIQGGDVKINDSVRLYLKEVGKRPLLKHDQEVAVAKRIEIGKKAKKELDANDAAVKSGKPSKFTSAKEDDLKAKAADGAAARNFLAESNLRLVVANAKRFANRGMPFLDLIQEGNMGLMKAIDKYDYTKGFKFSTYATWWIRQAISRAIADQARTIRMPVHMVELMNKINRVRGQLTQEMGRDPSPEEIAKAIDYQISADKIREIQKTALEPISFETPVGDDNDGRIEDFVKDDSDDSPVDFTSNSLTREQILNVLHGLSQREEDAIICRYGLNGNPPMTLEEVGIKMGITRERVRQIESSAIKKLRKPSFSVRLKKIKDSNEI